MIVSKLFLFQLTVASNLETLTLHSMTLSSLSLAMSCMLNGPLTCKAFAIRWVIHSILLRVSSFKSFGGVTSVASPEKDLIVIKWNFSNMKYGGLIQEYLTIYSNVYLTYTGKQLGS